MNKARSNITTIETAEKAYTELQQDEKSANGIEQEALPSRPVKGTYIDISG